MRLACFAVIALLFILPFSLAEETSPPATTTEAQSSGSSESGSSSQTEITDTSSSRSSESNTIADSSQTQQPTDATGGDGQQTGASAEPSSSVSGGGGTAENIATQISQDNQQPAPQECSQISTLAADAAGNCREFSNSCLPPGWSPVGKCPERPAFQQPAEQQISSPMSGSQPMPAGQGGAMPPPVQVPIGCREVREDTGFVRVVCEAQQKAPCPQYSDADAEKCKARNGRPDYFQDQRGCKIFECIFQESGSGGFLQPMRCPSEEERQSVSEKCKANGMSPAVRKDFSGCMFVDCVGSGSGQPQACPSEGELQKNIDACSGKGGRWISEFDRRGCKVVNCNIGGGGGSCKYVPKEAFDSCRNEGGEMVVKDDNGCITYANCVKRGDANSVAYERVDEVPQASALLSLAFKLEQLKIEFDKLSKQTDQIADYYASAGNKNEEERFRKVSSMFLGTNGKIDEIKTKMRGRMSSLTKDDAAEFKHDIKYIKEVVIQDILYVMLSTEGASAAIPSRTAAGSAMEGCGNDGECFNKALRTCEKTKFYPEGSRGTEVSIEGLEGRNCIIKALQKNPDGKAYDMTCKYSNYVMGMGKPEDLLPYCEGSMAENIKQNPVPQKVRQDENEGAAPRQAQRQPSAAAPETDMETQNPNIAPQERARRVERVPLQQDVKVIGSP